MVGNATINTLKLVSCSSNKHRHSKSTGNDVMLTTGISLRQINMGSSIHGWPTGHAVDLEDTIKFSALQNVDSIIQTFPLSQVNEAYGEYLPTYLD